MKNYILFTIIFLSFSCTAQDKIEFEYNHFENQFLTYHPIHNSEISKKEFDYANMIIEETKASLKSNPEIFYVSDYLNILSAFLTLKESEENIMIVYQKFTNSDGSCEFILHMEPKIKTNTKYDLIRDDYNRELVICKSNSNIEKEFNLTTYCNSNKVDIKLVEIINRINNDDQKNRQNHEIQTRLDEKNQGRIDSLYKSHKTYIGITLVGNKFNDVMWSVIQHSNTEMMLQYLPIIQEAVEEDELSVAPFKMLIDRLYGLKYGYQIFGTQQGFGFELADERKKKEIMLKYNIE